MTSMRSSYKEMKGEEKSSPEVTPLSYWLSVGHDMSYARAMQNLQADLEAPQRKVFSRVGEKQAVKLSPRAPWASRDIVERLLHEDMLCPSWQKFVDALCQLKKDRVEALHIFDIQLPNVVMAMLSSALKTKHIRELRLQNNMLHLGGVLPDLLQAASSSLARLDLSANPVPAQPARLCAAIATLRSLEYLSLAECNIGDNSAFLAAILGSAASLKELDLRGNHIGPRAAATISTFLTTNPALQILYLNENRLDDQTAPSFARALKRNTNLRWLVLWQNQFTRLGAQRIYNTAYDNSSLNAIVESNHTCWLDLCDGTAKFKDTTNLSHMNRCEHPALAIKRKILWTFRATDTWCSNLEYFNDVPIELIPNILALLQQDPTEQNQSLMKVFELSRNWKMPLLYTNISTHLH